jgi:hypothetical protein
MKALLTTIGGCLTILFAVASSSAGVVTTGLDWAPGSLRSVIASAAPGEIIAFDSSLAGQFVSIRTNQISLDRNITIDASALSVPAVITGYATNTEDYCLFRIQPGVTVRFSSLNLDSSQSSIVLNGGNLIVSNCAFTNSNSYRRHGGIRNETNASVTINDSSFSRLTFAILDSGGSIQISNTDFSQIGADGAYMNGVISSSGGSVALTHCTFSSNSALLTVNDGSLSIAASAISSIGIQITGGAGAISDCTFQGSETQSSSIFNNGSLTVANCQFNGNYYPSGILYNSAILVVTNCSFVGNSAYRGAAIYNYGNLAVQKTAFSANKVLDYGGAIFNEGGSARLIDCQFFGNGGSGGAICNKAELAAESCLFNANMAVTSHSIRTYGGAIWTEAGNLTLTACKLQGNNAIRGGAIYKPSGTMTLNRCEISGNSADAPGGGFGAPTTPTSGGGIDNYRGDLTINNSTIANNIVGPYLIPAGFPQPGFPPTYVSVSGIGGGIAVGEGSVTVSGTTFASNSGGGLVQSGGSGPMAVVNSTFLSNVVTGKGAGISSSGILKVEHCTLVGNTANSQAGGIFVGSIATINNSIIANNIGGADANVVGSFTASINLIGGDPKLSALGNYGGPTQTLIPLVGSPAIDAGATTTLQYDQRGLPRVINSVPDIGAVEVNLTGFTGELPNYILTTLMASGALELRFRFAPAKVYATDDLTLPFASWTLLGAAKETPPGSGIYRFEDTEAKPHRFFRMGD